MTPGFLAWTNAMVVTFETLASMIRLSSQVQTWTSPVVNHPVIATGSSFQDYVFNHNFGAQADDFRLFEGGGSVLRPNCQMPDQQFYFSSQNNFYYSRPYVSTTTSITMRTFRIYSVVTPLYFQFDVKGGEHK